MPRCVTTLFYTFSLFRLLQSQGDFLVRETSKATTTTHGYLRRNRMLHGGHHRNPQRGDSPSLTNLWAAANNATSPSGSTTSMFPSASSEEIRFGGGASTSNGKMVVTKMVLSVYWNGYKHFIIQGGEGASGSGVNGCDLGNRRGGWSLEEYAFPTIR